MVRKPILQAIGKSILGCAEAMRCLGREKALFVFMKLTEIQDDCSTADIEEICVTNDAEFCTIYKVQALREEG